MAGVRLGSYGHRLDLRQLLAERAFLLMMIGFCEPCSWTKFEVWEHLDISGDGDMGNNDDAVPM